MCIRDRSHSVNGLTVFGDISSSGKIRLDNTIFGEFNTATSTFGIGSDGTIEGITYGKSATGVKHKFNGHITASNNISSSGTIIGSNISASKCAIEDVLYIGDFSTSAAQL